MWLYFDQYGTLIEPSLQHGSAARTGTTDFQIFAYFDGIDLTTHNFATVKLIKPDFNDSSYPLLAMKYVPAMKYERMTGENHPLFSTSGGPNGDGYYPGFLFDFSNFSGDQNVAILLDTPGLWKAIINLYGVNHVISTQGTATFNVEAGTLDAETEITIDELMSSYASAIAGKLDITSGIVSVDNISDSSFDLSEYSNGQMFYDKASNKLYKKENGGLVQKFNFNITEADIDAKADKVINAVDEDLAMLDIEGNLKDSGIAKDNVALKTELNNKVDKVPGKGLSTNDFTDDYKTDVELNTAARHTHSNKTILDEITVAFTTEKDNALSRKADKVANAVNDDLASLDSNGNLKDSGVAVSKIGELDTRINGLENIGHFLSLWNATTGVAQKNPPHSPYIYHDGDYFRIGTAGTRIPNGTQYVIGGTNYVESQIVLGVGDVLYYDEGNEAWQIQTAGSGGQVVDVQLNGESLVRSGVANLTGGDIRLNQANSIVVYDALHNINGKALTSFKATETSVQGYSAIKIQLSSVNDSTPLTTQQASVYMKAQTGSAFVPVYNFDTPTYTYFIFNNLKVYKVQYDPINGLLLYYLNTLVKNEDLNYTNSNPTTATVGGISAGTTFTDKNVLSIIEDMLYPEIPLRNFSLTSNESSGAFEYGTTKTISTITPHFTLSSLSYPITSFKLGTTSGGSNIYSANTATNNQSITLSSAISWNGTSTYTIYGTITDGHTTKTTSISFSPVYSCYYIATLPTNPDNAPITNLIRTPSLDSDDGAEITYSANSFLYIYSHTKTESTCKIQTLVFGQDWTDVSVGTSYIGTKTITNSVGASVTYYVFRTASPMSGAGSGIFRLH